MSVVVGPNGSGKSNVTDAVLWAMGEQSPLAVRGQSMQDVIFGGGRGVQARSAAEVEIVLDNSDGTRRPAAERDLDRAPPRPQRRGRIPPQRRALPADGRDRGALRHGLGKETHSVISQGRVEAIVTSKPRERRLLIEEAAGLGKHRKRRRRAQLKLERTQENLDRALDVEREARTRLRPLKRQAEAAELHERLERQILQARWELAARSRRARGASSWPRPRRRVAEARAARERDRGAGCRRRSTGAARPSARWPSARERHDALSRRVYEARSARERLELRAEQVARERAERCSARIERVERRAREPRSRRRRRRRGRRHRGRRAHRGARGRARARSHAGREREIEREIAELDAEHEPPARARRAGRAEAAAARSARERADARGRGARARRLADAERGVQDARREAARVGAELAAANQFLRSHAARQRGPAGGSTSALSEELRVEDGYELALAAALGGRLDAALVRATSRGAEALLDRAGPDGGTALHRRPSARARPARRRAAARRPARAPAATC